MSNIPAEGCSGVIVTEGDYFVCKTCGYKRFVGPTGKKKTNAAFVSKRDLEAELARHREALAVAKGALENAKCFCLKWLDTRSGKSSVDVCKRCKALAEIDKLLEGL